MLKPQTLQRSQIEISRTRIATVSERVWIFKRVSKLGVVSESLVVLGRSLQVCPDEEDDGEDGDDGLDHQHVRVGSVIAGFDPGTFGWLAFFFGTFRQFPEKLVSRQDEKDRWGLEKNGFSLRWRRVEIWHWLSIIIVCSNCTKTFVVSLKMKWKGKVLVKFIFSSSLP